VSAPQGSDEWRQERCGSATASCFDAVMAKIKVGEAMTRIKYRLQLATERLTGIPVDGYQNAAMRFGIETEPQARMAYEAMRGVIVDEVGFVKHPRIQNCGASPDGLVGDDGMVEIKCPESTTHLTWMEAGVVPSEHVAQIQGQMAVCERQWVDFVSFDPRFPPNLQLFIVRVSRDDNYIKTLETEVLAFLAGVDAMVERLLKRAA
jgi:putative phage-type endonuclease